MSIKPVVVGVDGSAESLRAVEWAACAARSYGAPLRIVSAPAMPPRMNGYLGAVQSVGKTLTDMSVWALRTALTRAVETAPGLLADTDLLTGPPALAVTDSGAGAHMLVLGARGAGGFAAMLLGSVSRYAAMHAACPIVVVREQDSAVHDEIVVGVGDWHDSDAALGFAFAEAARRGVTLVVVHSWFWFPSPLRGPGGLEDTPEQAGDTAHITAGISERLAADLARWQEKYPQVPVRKDVMHGHPARILASYSARADLVVLGRHGAHAAGVIGGIQHAVLSHARGPVAVIPDEA
jgi:nucleotide-binding universal stress UspA family protein